VDLLGVLSQSHSTWLLSNTNPKHIQDEVEKKYLFPSLVDGTIYSFDARCRKPDRQIYDCLLERSQTEPEECIFIDDLIENVEAARLIGIHAIHYSNYNLLSKELKDLGVLIL
jgi:HAD superfamily hydrolase (TIGR01509 family)